MNKINGFYCVKQILNPNCQISNKNKNVKSLIIRSPKRVCFLQKTHLIIEDSNPFWALYDEYETKRKELGKERWAGLTDYAENYDQLTDAKYDAVIATMISLRKSNDKLTDTYYKKIKKVSGSKVAAQFFQLEAFFLSQIRATIMEEIPYIGEFDK